MNLTDAQVKAKQEGLKQFKAPSTDDKHVGVELEFSCPTPEDVLAYRLIESGLDTHVCAGRDGGAFQGEYGYEWRVLLKQTEMELKLKAIAKLISESGGKFHPESGFHVHLDMRHRDPAKAFNNLVRVQKILYGVADPIRSDVGGPGHWCRPQEKTFLGEAAKGKHTGINPLLTGTKNSIEVRIRESCVDGNDIYNWVRFLCTVVDSPMIPVTINNMGDLMKNVRMAKYTREYIKAKLSTNKKKDLLVEAV